MSAKLFVLDSIAEPLLWNVYFSVHFLLIMHALRVMFSTINQDPVLHRRTYPEQKTCPSLTRQQEYSIPYMYMSAQIHSHHVLKSQSTPVCTKQRTALSSTRVTGQLTIIFNLISSASLGRSRFLCNAQGPRTPNATAHTTTTAARTQSKECNDMSSTRITISIPSNGTFPWAFPTKIWKDVRLQDSADITI